MLDVLLEEVELLVLALGAEGASPDDILQLEPVLAPARLLLFHLI